MRVLLLTYTFLGSIAIASAQSWVMVDINPTGDSYPSDFTRFGDLLVFSADDGMNGRELWKTDGTESGTVLISDINPTAGSSPTEFYEFNGNMFFAADDGTNGVELWKTDGTMGGTSMVGDLVSGPGGSHPSGFCEAGGMLFFSAGGEFITDKSLWVTDGTGIGTHAVQDTGDANYIDIAYDDKVELDGKCFFFAYTPDSYHEVAISDGTSSGTSLIDINTAGASYPSGLVRVGGHAFFTADDGTHGNELWKSDGTPLGTMLVKDIEPGPIGSYPHSLQQANFGLDTSQLIMVPTTSTHGAEPWCSDGTEAGTKLLSDVYPGPTGSSPWQMTVLGNQLFFSGDNQGIGHELHRSAQLSLDPMNGAQMMGPDTTDINPGVGNSYPGYVATTPEVDSAFFGQTNVVFIAEQMAGDVRLFTFNDPTTVTYGPISMQDSAAFSNNQPVMIAPPNATQPNPAVFSVLKALDTRIVLAASFTLAGMEVHIYLPAFLTGEEPIEGPRLLQAYPNPTAGDITINLPYSVNQKWHKLELLDISGRHLEDLKTQDGITQVNYQMSESLENGFYLVQLKTEDLIQSVKILLQR